MRVDGGCFNFSAYDGDVKFRLLAVCVLFNAENKKGSHQLPFWLNRYLLLLYRAKAFVKAF
jgi:hypothetical protein